MLFWLGLRRGAICVISGCTDGIEVDNEYESGTWARVRVRHLEFLVHKV